MNVCTDSSIIELGWESVEVILSPRDKVRRSFISSVFDNFLEPVK